MIKSIRRISSVLVALVFSVSLIVSLSGAGAPASRPSGAPDYARQVKPLLEKYCYDCHGDGMDKGDLALDKHKTEAAMTGDIELWLGVWRNLESQLMPPAKKAQPTEAERQLVLQWIERSVFKVDPENPDPGRVTVRRLNREEYRNTILDLLNVQFEADDEFPADDTGYGFDTIGDVLNISPLLLEKYLEAAREISAQVLASTAGKVPSVTLGADELKVKDDPKKNAKWLPFASRAVAETTRDVKHAGPYKVSVQFRVAGSAEATTHTATLILRVNGAEAAKRHLSWDNSKSLTLTADATLKAGKNTLALEIVPGAAPPEGEEMLSLSANTITLSGPAGAGFMEYPSQYKRVFLDGPPPKDDAARDVYAKKILRHFTDRAFRRPVDEPTLDRLVKLARAIEKQPGMSFERGITHAMTAVLTSPRFIFRAEIQPEPDNPGRVVPIDEFALASRLSYFLWSSMPDDELFKLAREGKLRASLGAQVSRMLKDPKSHRLVENFVGQWLQTRDVEGINVDPRRVLNTRDRDKANRVFNSRVRKAMKDETELMFDHVLRQNQSALDLIRADYTFLNEPLAAFYGIQGVRGTDMRKVSLPPGSHRGGVLTHGSFLLVTSNPTRTSPVKRGLFILENILGTPAPPAPPNVPSLEEARSKLRPGLTMREIMEIHRQEPLCAGCHARMDPIGIALENYNALGMFRDQENGRKIATDGQLITGEKFRNVEELSRVLAGSRRKDFYRCLTEKLLTYTIGRGLEYYDTPTIDAIVTQLDKDGGKMHTLINGIVQSAPFQKRRGDGDRLGAVPHQSGK
jgi:Protein of unknown function (DUF1592)/Protein of unknown function (DUF1588)/Protein of unknown function (DUF1587)/Protein of unknown function (DUF1585)/Protein of unknown function (DUF1595)/Planctomycete cytochrome C